MPFNELIVLNISEILPELCFFWVSVFFPCPDSDSVLLGRPVRRIDSTSPDVQNRRKMFWRTETKIFLLNHALLKSVRSRNVRFRTLPLPHYHHHLLVVRSFPTNVVEMARRYCHYRVA